MRAIARFLPVRSQAIEQAPEQRLVSRQACCPGGLGLGDVSLVLAPGSPTVRGDCF